MLPKVYDGLARSKIRRSLRNRGRHHTYDPVSPVVIVSPPTCHNERSAARVGNSQEGTLSQRWDAVFAEALAEVHDHTIYDPSKPTDLYTDGSCTDNGRPFAAAGWGVHVSNSDQLGEYSGALAGQIQTNNRAELAAVEAALRLAWGSHHSNFRVIADCNLACLAIDNNSDEWSWRRALGMNGWLQRWEMRGWRTATGKRVRHADIWRRILSLLRLFESSADRSVAVMHVKAHDGSQGNERADKLAKEGAKLRFDLMELAAPHNTWFHQALALYWSNRKINDD